MILFDSNRIIYFKSMENFKITNIEDAYKICFKKTCTNKEIPCKEKYLRRLINAAHNDNSGVYFFVSFDAYIKINEPIVRFKCFILLHILFTNCSFGKRLLSYCTSMLNQIEETEFNNFIYCKLCDLYQEIFFYKVQFLNKFTFLTINYSLIDNMIKVPFKTNIAKIAFLKDISSHFTLHCKLINEILKNTQYVGIDPSTVLSNQCQMRAIIPLLKDIQNIFTIMHKIATDLSESSEKDNDTKKAYEISFIPHFKIYKKIIEKVNYLNYITEQYTLPKLPDTYPFLSPQLFKQPSPVNQAVRTPNSHDLISLNVTSYERSANKKSISFSVNDLSLKNISNIIPDSNYPLKEKSPNIADSTSELRIKELEEKLKDYEIISKLNEDLTIKVSELSHKIESISLVNENLRQKLDSEKVSSANMEVYKRKFESISGLYTDIRSRYKEMCENKNQSSQQSESFIFENQRLLEENASIKIQLEKSYDDLKKLNDVKNQLNENISQTKFQEKTDLLCNLLNRIVTENMKHFENYSMQHVCFENISKSSLIKILNDTSQYLKVFSYKVSEEQEDKNNLIIAQSYIQHTFTVIYGYCQQYLNASYDEEFEKHFQNLRCLYYDTMNSIKENKLKFDICLYAQNFQKNIDKMVLRINSKEEIFSTAAENVNNFDFENEMLNVLKTIKDATAKIADIEKTGINIAESENQFNSDTNDILELLRRLIETTRVIELEIMTKEGTMSTNRKSFYKENSSWASGMVGFSKSIGETVNMLILTIDGFKKGEVFMDELTVSLNNVIHLITQLLYSMRIKADKFSPNLAKLTQIYIAIKLKISEISINAKNSMKTNKESQIDVSNMSQTKRLALENDIQIRILGLDEELKCERRKLCRLRESQYKK